MQRLYVLYDERCGLCRWARRWVEDRPMFLELVFVAAGSEHAMRLFPTLATTDPPEELIVVSDRGEVYKGGSAWVIVLYALRDYREWSLRLGSPLLFPLARQAFTWLSRERVKFSGWLGLDQTDEEMAQVLACVDSPVCEMTDAVTASRSERPRHEPSVKTNRSRGLGWRREFGL